MAEPLGDGWQDLGGGADVLDRLRSLAPAEVSVRHGLGSGQNPWVEVPSTSFRIQGRLCLIPGRDRFGIRVAGWGAKDFVWLALRRGRGGPDYWQGAVEYRPSGRPALVFYFTAPLGGIQVRARRIKETDP